jgi:hypothetical protein
MDDIFARSFIIFVLLLYATVAFIFIFAAFRRWIWRPIANKFRGQSQEKNYQGIKSPSHEESPS